MTRQQSAFSAETLAELARIKRERQTREAQQHDGAEYNLSNERAAAGASNERSIIAIRASDLTPESINWAWPNRFAFGKMAMIAGDPGLGKSTILVDIAALHSRGGEFPCGEGRATVCETAILTAEDGLRDTLVPRLMAAEAVLDRIHFITGTRTEGTATDDTAMFDLARDVAVMRKYLKANAGIKIIIIDPLTAYLGAGAKAKENTDVRRVLTPLVKVAEEFGVLLLANNHLNKNGGKALYRILDSIAFVALGRTIHLVAEDPDNRENKKFICDKSNIGSKPLGLTYIIQKCWIKGEQGEEIETSRILWGTKHIDETADEALGGGDDAPTMAEEAKKFLREVLANGRMAVHDIEAEARAAGMLGPTKEIRNSKPFRKACEELGVVHTREGFGPGAKYYWNLP
jgi:putative DNA primase/helicase